MKLPLMSIKHNFYSKRIYVLKLFILQTIYFSPPKSLRIRSNLLSILSSWLFILFSTASKLSTYLSSRFFILSSIASKYSIYLPIGKTPGSHQFPTIHLNLSHPRHFLHHYQQPGIVSFIVYFQNLIVYLSSFVVAKFQIYFLRIYKN